MKSSTRLSEQHRKKLHRQLNQLIDDVRWLMIEQRIDRVRDEFRCELAETLRRIDQKTGTATFDQHAETALEVTWEEAPRAVFCHHVFHSTDPDELCAEGCGVEYGEDMR